MHGEASARRAGAHAYSPLRAVRSLHGHARQAGGPPTAICALGRELVQLAGWRRRRAGGVRDTRQPPNAPGRERYRREVEGPACVGGSRQRRRPRQCEHLAALAGLDAVPADPAAHLLATGKRPGVVHLTAGDRRRDDRSALHVRVAGGLDPLLSTAHRVEPDAGDPTRAVPAGGPRERDSPATQDRALPARSRRARRAGRPSGASTWGCRAASARTGRHGHRPVRGRSRRRAQMRSGSPRSKAGTPSCRRCWRSRRASRGRWRS